MADEIDEIRSRIDIVDLVGQRVQLKKAGKNYQGLCPFHDDKRPSFTVNPQLQLYKCWSCQEGGDIFTWVMKTQNVEFPEAKEILAAAAGVTLSRRGSDRVSKSERALNLEIMEAALAFFREHLAKSPIAKDYLSNRGMDEGVADEWELGYAPDVGEALAIHLKKRGYSLSHCRTLFLVEEDSGGGYYDKFRGRLMFPIRDARGHLVAFGGRVLGDGLPKYINSSDTPLYRKSHVLYGLHKASTSGSKSKGRQAVLCEGYFDVIACHRAGVNGAVASLGTALSEPHADLLKRFSDEVIILYDADKAGQKAAATALETLKKAGMPAKVALMPSGDDPDTLLRRQGPAAVVEAVQQASLPTTFRLSQIVIAHPEKGQQFWADVVEALIQASDIPEIERHIERLVSQYAGVEDQLFVREKLREQVLARRRATKSSQSHPKPEAFVLKAAELASSEAAVVAALLTPGLRVLAHQALIQPNLFYSGAGSAFAAGYAAVYGTEPPHGEASVWIQNLDQPMQDLVQQCASDPRFDSLSDRFVKDAVAQLVKRRDKSEIQRLKQQEGPDRLSKINQRLKEQKGFTSQ